MNTSIMSHDGRGNTWSTHGRFRPSMCAFVCVCANQYCSLQHTGTFNIHNIIVVVYTFSYRIIQYNTKPNSCVAVKPVDFQNAEQFATLVALLPGGGEAAAAAAAEMRLEMG
jgi:hypothetical protein